MFRLNNYIRNQNGLTLIELLATIVILAIVSTLVFSILKNSLETNRAIQQETMLRDEADIIVSKFIKTIYSTKQSHIVRNIDNKYLEVTNNISKCSKDKNGAWILDNPCLQTLEPIGFKTVDNITSIYLKKEQYTVQNSHIKILESSTINGDPKVDSLYEIDLELVVTKRSLDTSKPKKMVFKNQIQPIISTK